MATVFEPIRPVPPMTTIFMVYLPKRGSNASEEDIRASNASAHCKPVSLVLNPSKVVLGHSGKVAFSGRNTRQPTRFHENSISPQQLRPLGTPGRGACGTRPCPRHRPAIDDHARS